MLYAVTLTSHESLYSSATLSRYCDEVNIDPYHTLKKSPAGRIMNFFHGGAPLPLGDRHQFLPTRTPAGAGGHPPPAGRRHRLAAAGEATVSQKLRLLLEILT